MNKKQSLWVESNNLCTHENTQLFQQSIFLNACACAVSGILSANIHPSMVLTLSVDKRVYSGGPEHTWQNKWGAFGVCFSDKYVVSGETFCDLCENC